VHTQLDAIVTRADARHGVDQLHSEEAGDQVAFAGVICHGAATGAGLPRLNASLSNGADRRRAWRLAYRAPRYY
jgi:G3E family GTPase